MNTIIQLPPRNAPASPIARGFSEAVADLSFNLWNRWQDEKDYEDINDYLEPYKPLAKKYGVELIKMTKRPFGLQFRISDGREYQISTTSRATGYQRIK